MSESKLAHSVLMGIGERMVSFAQAHPRGYLGFTTLIALAGFAWLLLFPWLVVFGIFKIGGTLFSSSDIVWSTVLVWFLVGAFAALTSYRGVRMKPVLPAGLVLGEERTPALFSMVQKLHAHYGGPAVHRIVVTGEYGLDIVRTPRWVLPIEFTSTLVVGLPLMQSSSALQFECAVARRLGQFSKRYNRLLNWLYQLRAIWPRYCGARTGWMEPGYQPLHWFFSVFAPLYAMVSVSAARRDELTADRYAMELFSDDEVLDMVTTHAVCKMYLQKNYWPAIQKMAAGDLSSMPLPHAGMPAVLSTGLQMDNLGKQVENALAEAVQLQDAVPSLADRVENIGHNQARMYAVAEETAAMHYLGKSIHGVVEAIDKRWLKTVLEERNRCRSNAREGQPTSPFVLLLKRFNVPALALVKNAITRAAG